MKICGDLIVTDNNSDGVRQAIEKYILKSWILQKSINIKFL
jgi:hypothetical protein